MKEIIIDDDIFNDAEIEEIKNILLNDLPWYLGTGIDSTVIGENYHFFKNKQDVFEYGQFTHRFIDNGNIYSNHYEIVLKIARAILKKYDFCQRLLRAKSNLMTKVVADKKNPYNTPHVDDEVPHWVVIYYVLDSDGDTFIFNETEIETDIISIKKRISPKKGRIVIFDGKYLHAGMHPVIYNYRSVINFNFAK